MLAAASRSLTRQLMSNDVRAPNVPSGSDP